MLPERIVDKLVAHYPRNEDGRVNFSDILEREGIVLKTMPDADADGPGWQSRANDILRQAVGLSR